MKKSIETRRRFLRAAATPNYSGQMPDANFFDTLYVYAWFVTFAIGFVLYLILMKAFPPEENLAADERG